MYVFSIQCCRLLSFLVICVFLSCNSDKPHSFSSDLYAVHYWNTTWNDSMLGSELAHTFRRVYLHVFDVDIQPGLSEPVPSFIIDTIKSVDKIEYIPIAYLTLDALEYYRSNKNEAKLATRMTTLISHISRKNHCRFDKFVLDFDWNVSNQDSYFTLLDTLSSLLNKQGIELSITLRLHQLRLADGMEAPPIDTLLLMCYNMNAPRPIATQNSIFNTSDFQSYAQYISSYPRNLEIVLPVFSQWIWFRNHEAKGLLRGASEYQFENNPKYRKMGSGMYEVTEDFTRGTLKLIKGDRIKHEKISKKDLISMVDILGNQDLDSPKVSLFDLQSLVERHEMQDVIEELFYPQ